MTTRIRASLPMCPLSLIHISLQEKLVGQEGIDKDNIIEIKEDDISNEKDRRIFLEYILKNAGASEEYINGIHSIDIEFDEDDKMCIRDSLCGRDHRQGGSECHSGKLQEP